MATRIGLLVVLVGLVVAAVYWMAFRPNNSSVQTSSPVTVAAATPAQPMPQPMTPADAMVLYRSRYRLPVDRRFIEGLEFVRAFPGTAKTGSVQSRFLDGHWDIRADDKIMGQLPAYPDFSDAMILLRRVATERLHGLTVTPGNPAPALTTAAVAFDEAQLEYTLFSLNHAYQSNGLTTTGLKLAAQALSRLTYLEDDQTGTADALYGKAMALVALAEAATGSTMPEAEGLLASAMGYSGAADRSASALPQDNAWRLYLIRDDDALQGLVKRYPQSSAPIYFWLRRLADLDHRNDWGVWYRHNYSDDVSVAALGTEFRLQGHTPLVEGAGNVARAVIVSVIGASAASDELQPQDPYAAPAKVLTAFSRGMASLGPQIAGPYMTANDIGAYYRGYLYDAYYRLALYLIDVWGQPTGAAAFNAGLASASGTAARDFHTWYGLKIASETGGVSLEQVNAAIDADASFDPGLYNSVIIRFMASQQAGSPPNRAAARWLAGRYDTRPALRADYADLLWYALDVPGVDDIYASLSGQESKADPFYRLFIYAYDGDDASLLKVAQDTQLGPDARIAALDDLSVLPSHADKITAAYQNLVRQYPTAGEVYADYIDFLQKQKEYTAVVRVARLWLASQPADKSVFDFWNATIAVADAELQQGKADEAWGALSPALFQPQHIQTIFGTVSFTSSTGYGKALDEGVQIALARGDIATASELAREVSSTYSDSFSSQMAWLRVLWTQGQYPAAAQWLAAWKNPVTDWQWRHDAGKTFADVFGQDTAKAARAFASLILAHAVSTQALFEIVSAELDAGQPGVAFSLVQQIPLTGEGKLLNLVTAYTWLKQDKGMQEAEAWLAPHLPAQHRDFQSMFFYDSQAYELLWSMIPDTAGLQRPEEVWLLRAAAAAQGGALTETQNRAMHNYFTTAGDGWYQTLGRYVYGEGKADAILDRKLDAHALSEASYYLALRALKDGHYRQGAEWLNVDMDTDQVRNGEYRWGQQLLSSWLNKRQSLQVLAGKGQLFNTH